VEGGGLLRNAGNLLLSLGRATGGTCGVAWVGTSDLENFLINDLLFSFTALDIQPREAPTPRPNSGGSLSLTDILPGDVVFFYQNDPNNPNHAGVVIGWGPPIVSSNGERRLDFNANPVPWIADNGGPGFIRPINDIGLPSRPTKIVHVIYP
jgi:hypothetical protein